jgi:hypothetical protein
LPACHHNYPHLVRTNFLTDGGTEPVFVKVYGAQESIPRNRFRQCSLAGQYDK